MWWPKTRTTTPEPRPLDPGPCLDTPETDRVWDGDGRISSVKSIPPYFVGHERFVSALRSTWVPERNRRVPSVRSDRTSPGLPRDPSTRRVKSDLRVDPTSPGLPTSTSIFPRESLCCLCGSGHRYFGVPVRPSRPVGVRRSGLGKGDPRPGKVPVCLGVPGPDSLGNRGVIVPGTG